MSESEFDNIIKVTRICMRLTGVWPKSEQSIFSVLKVFICAFTVSFFVLIPQTTKLILTKNNLNDAVELLTVGSLVGLIALCKLFNECYNKRGKN